MEDDLGQSYEVISFCEEHFYSSLSNNNFCRKSEAASNNIANFLYRYLRHLEAKTLVIENTYVNGDYLEDYSSYYVRCFKYYDRRCKRIHIFSKDFDIAFLNNIICRSFTDKKKMNSFKASYLGFIVARPLPSAIIGKTVLKTYPSDNGRRNYTTLRPYEVNLFGIYLQIESLAFQEQDTVVGACATVALWSAFHKTANLFGTPTASPAEITRTANAVGSSQRATPSRGLTVEQIAQAIRSNGLEPELLQIFPNTPIISFIYSYLRLGLPILLGIAINDAPRDQGGDTPQDQEGALHVLTVSGYSINESKIRPYEVYHDDKGIKSNTPFTGLRIDELYAHDDQQGPFSRLRVIPSNDKRYPVLFQDHRNDKILAPKFALVPVYNKIRVTFLDIAPWVIKLWTLIKCLITTDFDHFAWDVYLVQVNELKINLRLA